MKTSISTLGLCLTLLMCTSAFAATNASTSAASSAATQPVMDKDANIVHLDVAQVLSDRTTGNPCGIDKARMLYLNHQGVEHELDYRVQGECPQQN